MILLKLIIPALIVCLGMLVAAAVCRVFDNTATGFTISVLAGGVGAFVGLLVRDFLDITHGGPLAGALLAAIAGAIFFAVITNFVFRRASSS